MAQVQEYLSQKRRVFRLCVLVTAGCSLALSVASAQPGQVSAGDGSAAAAASVAGPKDSYKIIYASHLFGYYRVPEVQTVAPVQDCKAGDIDKDKTPEAYVYQ